MPWAPHKDHGRVPWGRGGQGLCSLHGQHGAGLTDCPLAALGDEMVQAGTLQQWQLTLYGSVWSPVDIRDRQR